MSWSKNLSLSLNLCTGCSNKASRWHPWRHRSCCPGWMLAFSNIRIACFNFSRTPDPWPLSAQHPTGMNNKIAAHCRTKKGRGFCYPGLVEPERPYDNSVTRSRCLLFVRCCSARSELVVVSFHVKTPYQRQRLRVVFIRFPSGALRIQPFHWSKGAHLPPYRVNTTMSCDPKVTKC